jgi:hypothetical protein
MHALIWLLVPLGAFLWRLRGGLLNDLTGQANWMGCNDTVVRLIWSLGMAGVFWLFRMLPLWHAGLLAAALFAGTTIIGWFGAALLPARWRDVLLLSLSGTLRIAFVAVALLSPWPLFAGVLCGPVYWLAAKLPSPQPWMFWGEWFFGATIGASLCLVS